MCYYIQILNAVLHQLCYVWSPARCE